MNLEEAINQRVSRRSYESTSIDVTKRQTLQESILKYNKEQNLSISWIIDGSDAFNSLSKSYGLFNNVRTIIALKGKKDDKHLLEKIGYYGELLVLEATKLGLGTCWVGGTFKQNSSIFRVNDNEQLVAVITIGNVKTEKKLKEKLVSRMSHLNSKKIDSFYESDKPLPDRFLKAIKAVQKAPSALNKQPVVFTFKDNKITARVDDDSNKELIDLGIAKAHFDIVAKTSFPFGNNSSIEY